MVTKQKKIKIKKKHLYSSADYWRFGAKQNSSFGSKPFHWRGGNFSAETVHTEHVNPLDSPTLWLTKIKRRINGSSLFTDLTPTNLTHLYRDPPLIRKKSKIDFLTFVLLKYWNFISIYSIILLIYCWMWYSAYTDAFWSANTKARILEVGFPPIWYLLIFLWQQSGHMHLHCSIWKHCFLAYSN